MAQTTVIERQAFLVAGKALRQNQRQARHYAMAQDQI
jgi:hypothetical protein